MGSEASKQKKNVVDREANNEMIFLDYNHSNYQGLQRFLMVALTDDAIIVQTAM